MKFKQRSNAALLASCYINFTVNDSTTFRARLTLGKSVELGSGYFEKQSSSPALIIGFVNMRKVAALAVIFNVDSG